MTLPAPSLEHVCDLRVQAGEVTTLGPVRTGVRRIIPIAGGTMTGPLLNGVVVGNGADWQTVLADGVAELDARYQLRTDDGADIELVDRGFRHGPPEVMQRVAAGEDVPAELYYMRSAIRLETADERYRWVNSTVFVGTGARGPDGVTISLYAVR